MCKLLIDWRLCRTDAEDYYEGDATFDAAPPALKPEQSTRSQFIGAFANLSVQYNFSCLGIAVSVMTSHWDKTVTDGELRNGCG